MKKEIKGVILHQEQMATDCYRMIIQTEEEFLRQVQPGQFIHLKINELSGPLLRRPFSIHQVDMENSTMSLLYAVVGKGTKVIAMDLPGKKVGFLGPLGRGFPVHRNTFQHIVLVGGGLGAAPLLYTAEVLARNKMKATVILGYGDSSKVMLNEEFASLGIDTYLTTEDGSQGHHGYPTEILSQLLREDQVHKVFACGPNKMMERVAEITQEAGVEAWVSLEEKMACGVGACLGCVVKIRDESGIHYEKACKEGPVFKASEVIFHEI